jgi:exosortase A-associated hydrolase 2
LHPVRGDYAFFLPLHRGKRFCLLHSADPASGKRGAILYVHPFAEEMNKSRRMAALQAHAFAAAGWTVLQMDLFGCGDSDGEFGDADWPGWVNDVLEAAAWLRKESGSVPLLWGMRTGCLLAAQAARSLEPAPELLLWQPVITGRSFLQQFLRLKLAGQFVAGTRERTGTEDLRARLGAGETVEIAGHALSPGVASGLHAAELSSPVVPTRVAWLEIVATAGAELTPAATARVQAWQSAGNRVDARTVEAPAFWQTLEIAESAALIEATLAAVEGWQR